MGVHTGEVAVNETGYVGMEVHRAARIAAAGHGGQVLVSSATAALVEAPLRDLGDHRFNDLRAPERVFQLGSGEFPALKSLYRSNVPVPATPFLGREAELLAAVEMLSEAGARLVSLTGAGGTGKTRLALQAAAEASSLFPDGVWWVPLASLRDPSLVLPEVARVLDVDQPGRDLGEVLAEALAGKRLLLLLDNVEHLLPEAAPAVATLRGSDGPKIVVTSRERLQLAGEHVYPVPPLTEPEGVALFMARARALCPSLEASAAVEELCARLDNLPLAIEFAAARTVALSPEQILKRLSQRLDLLQAGRDVDPRQRTLRSMIEWSHDLLNPGERELFARLAVFSGGCTLEAAEEICDADLDTLAVLVDKSLVRRDSERFWMLETIREYAAERLDKSENADALRRRHASSYDRFTADAEMGMRGSSVRWWHDRVERELPNLRSASEFSIDRGDPVAALRMSAALSRFWFARGQREGRSWLDRALATGAGTAAERGEGLSRAAALAVFLGEAERAVPLLQEAIEQATSAGDDALLAWVLGVYGWALVEQGNDAEARAMMLRCRELASGLADPWAHAEAMVYVALILANTGDLEQADVLYRELLGIKRQLGDDTGVGIILNAAGWCAVLRSAYDEARSFLEESVTIARQLSLSAGITAALGNLGLVAVFQGRYTDALSLFEEDLQLCSAHGNRRLGAEAILGLAAAHAALGNLELAVKLDAISGALYDTTGRVYPPALLDRLEPHLRQARELCGPILVDEAFGPGRTLTLDTAIAEVGQYE
jgi:predicted ATPase